VQVGVFGEQLAGKPAAFLALAVGQRYQVAPLDAGMFGQGKQYLASGSSGTG
jgi:hypothetical protein